MSSSSPDATPDASRSAQPQTMRQYARQRADFWGSWASAGVGVGGALNSWGTLLEVSSKIPKSHALEVLLQRGGWGLMALGGLAAFGGLAAHVRSGAYANVVQQESPETEPGASSVGSLPAEAPQPQSLPLTEAGAQSPVVLPAAAPARQPTVESTPADATPFLTLDQLIARQRPR